MENLPPPIGADLSLPAESAAVLTPQEFHKRKFRAKHTELNVPYQGFGPRGNYTLYLPSPTPKLVHVFRGGRPQRSVSDTVMGNQEIATLRDRVITSFASEGPGLLSVDLSFLEYAAAVIRINYDVTDDDLTLLLSGAAWHKSIVSHLLGGNDIMAALRTLAPRRFKPESVMRFEAPMVTGEAAPDTEDAELVERPEQVSSWIRRAFDRLLRRR